MYAKAPKHVKKPIKVSLLRVGRKTRLLGISFTSGRVLPDTAAAKTPCVLTQITL